MIISVLLFLQFYLSFVFQYFKEVKLYKKIIFIISLFVFYFLFIGIRDSADWEIYDKVFFNIEEYDLDVLFNYSSLFARYLGYSFQDLFALHIILYGYFFVKFIAHFTQNIIFVLGFFIVLTYVPLANQIRYFLALSLFLNGLYYYSFAKKKTSYIYFLFSLLSHSSMLVLLSFLFLEKKVGIENYAKKMLMYCLLFFFTFNAIVSFGILDLLGQFHFKTYIQEDLLVSNVFGGIFNELPFIFTLILFYYWLKNIIKENAFLLEDKVFVFLYKLTFYSVLFIPISFNFQIIGHRYVQAFIIIWLCLYVYTLKKIEIKKMIIQHFAVLNIWILFLMFYLYYLPIFVFGMPNAIYYLEFIRSFNSIEYLPNI